MKNSPKFGPSGNSMAFAAAGHKSTLEMPEWVSGLGLNLFEYPFGRGIHISDEHAAEIGRHAKEKDIEISVHAPYFINFGSNEEQKVENSKNYLVNSLLKLKAFGGTRCVFHPGSQGKMTREEAFLRTKDGIEYACNCIKELELDNFIICAETMGKMAQIGDVDEVIEICNIAPFVYPCIDFGHVNAREHGLLKDEDAFQRIIDKMFDGIGEEKTKNMHVHFSKIEYSDKGEVRHLTFEDTKYGPNFEPFAKVMVKNGLTPHILSESAGTQDIDARTMKDIYFGLLNK